jgi:S1-C subfamily serine protease
VLGSAVVIDPAGYLVTNWHVIEGADQIRVQLADGRVAVPTLVGADPDTELALLHIDENNLPSIKLGRSDSLRVGDVVLAIGNSLGLSHTVTMGIVSATGRGRLGVTRFEDFIQTDAAINVGNSGGALINADGELVGINTAVISSTLRDRVLPEGIGFAIPVNLVRGVMAQLIEHGRVIRGYLGVEGTDLSARDARPYGVDGPAVRLDLINAQSPAEAAGLLSGDVLTHIDQERVFDQQQAMNAIAAGQPGDHVHIRVTRPGAGTVDAEAVLEERPTPTEQQGS